MSDPLEALAAVHRDPHAAARRHHDAGGLVIACVGVDVPAEPLAAAGLFALWVTGDPARAREDADQFLGPSTDERSRSQLARLLDGEFDYVDRLLVGHDCEGSRRLFACVSELRRLTLRTELPPPHMLDLLHLPYRSTQIYNHARIVELCETVGRWSGRPPGIDEIRAAVDTANERRRLVRRLAELRAADPPRLTGVQALLAIGAGRFLDPAQHARMLADVLERADELRPHEGLRVFVTGSDHDHPALYALVESCGAVIVGEDEWWGAPIAMDAIPVTADPLHGLAQRYQARTPAPATHAIANRARATAEQAIACGAQAVIGFGRRGDDAPAWDHPAQRRALAEHGIPMTFVGHVPYASTPPAECTEAVVGFVAGVSAAAESGGVGAVAS